VTLSTTIACTTVWADAFMNCASTSQSRLICGTLLQSLDCKTTTYASLLPWLRTNETSGARQRGVGPKPQRTAATSCPGDNDGQG
jgi:hypothetical protein